MLGHSTYLDQDTQLGIIRRVHALVDGWLVTEHVDGTFHAYAPQHVCNALGGLIAVSLRSADIIEARESIAYWVGA